MDICLEITSPRLAGGIHSCWQTRVLSPTSRNYFPAFSGGNPVAVAVEAPVAAPSLEITSPRLAGGICVVCNR